ncbi:uncharacterized protein LOC111702502 [Eurytemora carolleeae]|uniref:uncharacterized protein LOC111702502 n=1 Tax=Eurytemora carolleeae TaxID=1294199 RepID=UPI000C76F8EE|nr:uncharacterized protein LOC111702502 [Eurytemora carolleeae]|eukprot:XP_023329990.1 uncharacterized protein LOC111702502 [Eurytemora affinis]
MRACRCVQMQERYINTYISQFISTGGADWAGQSKAPGETWIQPQSPRGPLIRPPPQPSMSWNLGRYPPQYAVDTTQYRPSYPVPDVCKMTPPASCPLSWIGQTPRWFFNTNLYTCVEFMYGCGEGHNNFISESECKMVCSEKPEVVYNLPRGNRVPPFFHPRRPADPNFYPNQPNQITSMPPVYRGPTWDSTKSLSGLTGLTKSTFDRYLQNNRHVLVEFYANWCQTCIEFQPKFKLMARNLNSLGVATAQVNAVEEDELRRRFNVQSVPTLLFWSRDLPDCPRKFSNKFGLNSSSVVSWVQNQLGAASSQISWMLSPSSSSQGNTFASSLSSVPVNFSPSTFRPQETTFTFRPQPARSTLIPKPTTSTRTPAQTIFTIKPEVANPAKTTTPTTFKPQPAISTFRPQTASTIVTPKAVTVPIETTDTTFVETTFTAQPASSTIRSKPVTSTKRPQLATSTLKEQLVTVTSTATAELATSSPTEATTTIYATTYDTSDVSYAWENEGDYVLPTDIPTGTTFESECDTVCVKAWNPVCGSDNLTYSNLCEYNVAQCKNSDLYMLGTGECSNLQLGTICKRTEFLCQESGKCISFLKTCNGKLDCENGSDEKLCEGCSKTEFTCGDGTCIDYSKRCDKKIDCKDSSDESGCMKPCSLQEFTCNDGSCIEQAQRCDGQIHCKDMTDEIGCDAFNFCLSSEWMCVDKRRCISSSRRCDGFPDCGDVSDEQGCPPQTCNTKWLFPCSNSSQCIDSRRRCDGYTDCQDRSDERGCRELQCQEWQFKCKQDGVCLHEALRCDSVQDCRDGSDEDDCFSDPASTVFPYTTIPPSTINPQGLETESVDEYIDEGSSIYTTEIYYQITTVV